MSIHVGTVIPIIPKDPNSRLLYGFDWTEWLGSANILTSQWIVPAGVTADQETNTAKITQVRIAGGTVGTTYTVTNRITTNETPDQIEDRSFKLKIKDL